MYIHKLPNAAASKIAVTNTATTLEDLITTAASATFEFNQENAFFIHVEDGNIRMLMDGNTPTDTNGVLLTEGEKYYFPNIPIHNVTLIRVGGSNVACSVQVGRSDVGESAVLGGTGPSTLSGTVNVDTEFATATEGEAAASTGMQIMGRYDSTVPTAVDDGDAVGLLTDSVGRLRVLGQDLQTANGDSVMDDTADAVKSILQANSGVDIGDVDVTSLPGELSGPGTPSVDSYSHVAINLTTGANQVLVSSAANKQIWIYGYGFTCGDADGQTVSLQDEDDTAVTGIMEFAQYGGISVSPSGNFAMPIHKLTTNKDLEVDITGGDVDGWIAYAIVDVS